MCVCVCVRRFSFLYDFDGILSAVMVIGFNEELMMATDNGLEQEKRKNMGTDADWGEKRTNFSFFFCHRMKSVDRKKERERKRERMLHQI